MVKGRDLPVIPLSSEPIRSGVDPSAQAVHLELEPVGPVSGPRIGLVTLGCDKNTVDSEHMMAALVGHGARVSGDVEGSDVVIVNTCGFIDAAKEESIGTILEACGLKEAGEVKAVVAETPSGHGEGACKSSHWSGGMFPLRAAQKFHHVDAS